MTFIQPNVVVVTPNGWIRDTIVSVTVERTLNAVGQATIVLAGTTPFIDPETRIRILGRHHPDEPLREVFVGFVDTNTVSVESGTITITCRDLLKKAADTFLVQPVKFGIDPVNQQYFYSTYTTISGGTFTIHQYSSLSDLHTNHPETQNNITHEGVRAEAVVQWLLVMCGLREGDEILVQPTNFFIGDTSPVTFHLMSVYDAIMQIAELIGWDVYTDVHRVLFTPRGQTRGTFVCSTTRDTGNVLSLSVDVTNEPLRNYVEVIGASGITYVARAPSPYIGSTPYRGVLYASEYVDTPGLARFIAERILSDLNKLHHQYRVTTVGDWSVSLQSLVVLESNLSVPSRLKIESLTHTYGQQGFTTTVTAVPVPQDFYYDDPPIELAFSITYLMTIGDPKLVVILDASPSATVVDIAFVQWVVNGVEYPWSPHTTLTVVLDRHQVLSGGVLVTLRVKTPSNIVHQTQRTVTYDMIFAEGEGEVYPFLYAALTTKAIGSDDGGQTWNEQSIPAISVAASNFDINAVQQISDNYTLFGCSDGVLYRTVDACRTVEVVHTASGPITHVFIHPLTPLIAVCVHNRTDLYISIDAGLTWTAIGSVSDPIVDGEFIYSSDLIALRCVSATHSFTITCTSSSITVTPNDITAAETGLFDPDRFSGDSFTWTAAAPYYGKPHFFYGMGKAGVMLSVDSYPGLHLFHFPDFAPIGVAAMTPDLNRPIIHVVGYDNVLYNAVVPSGTESISSVSGTQPRITSLIELTPAGQYNPMTFAHALRDGTFHDLIYYATSSGVYKSLDGNHSVASLYNAGEPVPIGGWGKMVAYGPLGKRKIVSPSNLVVHMVNPDDVYRVTSDGSYEWFGTSIRDYLLIARSDTIVSSGVTGGFILVEPLYMHHFIVGGIDSGMLYTTSSVEGTPSATDPPFPSSYNPTTFPYLIGVYSVPSGNRHVLHPVVPLLSPTSDVYQLHIPCNPIRTSSDHYITVPYTRFAGGLQLSRYAGVFVIDLNGNVVHSKDDVVSLGSIGTGGTDSSLYVGQFFTTPHTTSTRSMLWCLRGGHPFVPKNIQVMIHVPTTITTSYRPTPEGYEHGSDDDIAPLIKFDALRKAIVVRVQGGLIDIDNRSGTRSIWANPYPNGDVFYAEYVVTGQTISITKTQLPWQKPIIAAHKSFEHPSSVYYATDTTVFLVSDYGRGSQTSIFTAPPSYTIVSFTVTSSYPHDALAVAVAKTENAVQVGYIYTSTDGGNTWNRHAFRAATSLGYIVGAWIVASSSGL